jgi:hypothetical protein
MRWGRMQWGKRSGSKPGLANEDQGGTEGQDRSWATGLSMGVCCVVGRGEVEDGGGGSVWSRQLGG